MKHLMWLLLMTPLASFANTFVGNGGGAGDVELSVTKKQIEEAFRVINRKRDNEEAVICKCNPTYSNRSVCEPVRTLDDKQRRFCSATLIKQAPEILRMATNDNAVSFRWTDEQIRVADRGETRAVDAVTNREKREITINLKRFLEMRQFERVFLITHELMHLTSLDGKPLVDEGGIGPFEGDEGGRRLLNAMGSTAAVLQGEYPREIKSYKARLNRSQGWKPYWIDANVGQANMSGAPGGTFATDDFKRSQFTARYALGSFVFAASYGSQTSDKTALGTVKVNEEKEIFSVGIGYRIFPFGDPETFWGQTHFLVQVMADHVNADLKLTSNFDLKYKTDVWGGSGALHYYVPVFWGLWGYAGVSYEVHPYKYEGVNVKYDKNIFSQYVGVAYGF